MCFAIQRRRVACLIFGAMIKNSNSIVLLYLLLQGKGAIHQCIRGLHVQFSINYGA